MISQLSAKYQFGAIHTVDATDGKVTNRAFCPPNPRKPKVYTFPTELQPDEAREGGGRVYYPQWHMHISTEQIGIHGTYCQNMTLPKT